MLETGEWVMTRAAGLRDRREHTDRGYRDASAPRLYSLSWAFRNPGVQGVPRARWQAGAQG